MKTFCALVLVLASVLTGRAQSGNSFAVAGVEFSPPSGWKAVTPASTMRAGQWIALEESRKGQEDPVEVVVFFFGQGQGGDAASNIARWQGTMSIAGGKPAPSQTQSRMVNGYKISEVVAYGTYSGSMAATGAPPTPKAGYGLAGVVVESPGGNIFVRMTGSERLVKKALPTLREFINSAHPAN